MSKRLFIFILGILLMTGREPITQKQIEALQFLGGPSAHCMLEGGSGSGKTYIGVDALVARSILAPGSRHGLFRSRFNHAKISIWNDTLPTVLDKRFPNVEYNFNHSDHYVEFANGSQIWIGGLDEKARVEKILGMTLATLYFNECSQITYEAIQIAWTRLRQLVAVIDPKTGKPGSQMLRLKSLYDQNPPSKKHWSYLLFHEHIDPEDRTALEEPEDYQAIQMHPRDNLINLGDGYLKMLQRLSARKRKRFWDGKYGDDVEGALWTSDMIGATRVLSRPLSMKKVGVGVDPAVTSNPDSNETGIITGGIDGAGHLFTWRDDTCLATPGGWARKAINAYMDEHADAIIAEVNQGGDLVESNIKQTAKTMGVPIPKVVKVRASRGKYARAEPIAALMEADDQGNYEKARDHIVGEMPDLEGELTGWSPVEDDESPNRLDAKVWLGHWLIGTHKHAGTWGDRNRPHGTPKAKMRRGRR